MSLCSTPVPSPQPRLELKLTRDPSASNSAFATSGLAFVLPVVGLPQHGRGVSQPSMQDKLTGAAVARLGSVEIDAVIPFSRSSLSTLGLEGPVQDIRCYSQPVSTQTFPVFELLSRTLLTIFIIFQSNWMETGHWLCQLRCNRRNIFRTSRTNGAFGFAGARATPVIHALFLTNWAGHGKHRIAAIMHPFGKSSELFP
ncbi:hypothetical protein LX32DRAFT_440702 [Colletotrichum zoysiae]|uniref:Uncharacterized protein n=1 Tax=Colletotrichum zoysiae TaxID=1216348 RepID=A0AAD9HGA9_9PEZI|nr:hypothetical protein LX32DRAFT_440702 [Colletotrichum zoysiae]